MFEEVVLGCCGLFQDGIRGRRLAYVVTQGWVEMEGAPAEVGEAVADLYLRVAATSPNGRRTDTDTGWS